MSRLARFSLTLLFLTTQPAPAGKDASDYLTKDGTLMHTLEILDVQGGFAGFTGTLLKVQPDGAWKRTSVNFNKTKTLGEGQLTKAQLADMAKGLAKYDLLHLADEGKPMVNPHNVTITFGKHTCELRLGGGKKLPEPGDGVAGRYAGVVQTAQELCRAKTEPKK
jgi:hypothetical protein